MIGAIARVRRHLQSSLSPGRARAHRLFHPLCGATLPTLLRLAAKGGVALPRAHVLGIALAMALLRSPFTLAEALFSHASRWASSLRPAPTPASPPLAPVFIVGHWRSGTTHLANLLSRSSAFAILSPLDVGLPAEALGLARLVRPLIERWFPPNRLIDEIPLAADLPQEDELALAGLCSLSCNHGLYFPSRLEKEYARGLFGEGVGAREQRRWHRAQRNYIAKMSRAAAPGRHLLVRNPASSTRIDELAAMWPGCRFIHIHREPAAVVASATRMTETLLREISLGRRDAAAPGRAARLVRDTYPEFMRRLLASCDRLEPSRVVEIRFDDLLRQPIEALRRIHEHLELPGFEAAQPRFDAYLQRTGGHVPRHYPLGRADRDWLAEHAAPISYRLGYGLLPRSSAGLDRLAAQ